MYRPPFQFLYNQRCVAAAFFIGALAASPNAAFAWGTTGHREINLVAMRALPSSVPRFLQTDQAVTTVETLGPEEDFLEGAGVSWDRDDDPGHYVDVADDGTIGSRVTLRQLPTDMQAYTKALAAAGTDPYAVGYLPYAIADGGDQVRKDFAYWRAFDYLEVHAGTRGPARLLQPPVRCGNRLSFTISASGATSWATEASRCTLRFTTTVGATIPIQINIPTTTSTPSLKARSFATT